VICVSFIPEAAHTSVLPLFHTEELTVCPSKSKNTVADAVERLLSLGKLLAFSEVRKANNTISV
jgi:hypothetical protein